MRGKIGQLIIEADLVGEPSAEVLAAVWRELKNQPIEKKLGEAKSPTEIQEALTAPRPAGASGFFGR